MKTILRSTIIALGLTGAMLVAASPASAADVGIRIGGPGVGVQIGNGHYYDSHHRRQSYNYPSDWKTYHHPQNWYRSHQQWNDQNGHDWYRR
jgi:hypothetical protein